MYRILFIILLLITIFCACQGKNETEQNQRTNNDNTIINKEVDYTSFIKNDPNNIYVSSLRDDSTFIGLFCKTNTFVDATLYLKKYKLTHCEADSISYQTIQYLDEQYIKIDTTLTKETVIKDTPYILFSCSEGAWGSAAIYQSVSFYALNMQDLSVFFLEYTGRHQYFKCEECIVGQFTENKQLEKYPLIKKELLQLSQKSKLIYQHTKRDEDKYYYLNFEEKWNDDNMRENIYGIGRSSIDDTIRSTYYKTNLFEVMSKYGDNFIENDKYKIANYFRSNIIGYDKYQNLYFPILIETCVQDCNKDIELTDDNSLIIKYNEYYDETYNISLDNIIFDTKHGD